MICFKGIPIELAAPGSSATALNPSPIFVYLNKSVRRAIIPKATKPAVKSSALINNFKLSAIHGMGKSPIPRLSFLTSTPHFA